MEGGSRNRVTPGGGHQGNYQAELDARSPGTLGNRSHRENRRPGLGGSGRLGHWTPTGKTMTLATISIQTIETKDLPLINYGGN